MQTPKTKELKDQIYNAFTEQLKKGVPLWEAPAGVRLPRNIFTGKEYRGSNILRLLAFNFTTKKAMDCMTYQQARECGAQVKKGSKAFKVLYSSKHVTKATKHLPKEEQEFYSFTSCFNVFSVDDIKDLPTSITDKLKKGLNTHTPIKEIEKFVSNLKANISHKYSSYGCYTLATDEVMTAPKEQFKSVKHYYSTLFHELTHWTAHKSRLNRTPAKRKYDKDYCIEELTAELGASMLCIKFGLGYQTNHTAYIDNYLQELNNDKQILSKALNQAQDAFDYLVALQG